MSDFYGSRQEITEKGNLFYRQAGNAWLMLETIESGEKGKDGGSEAELAQRVLLQAAALMQRAEMLDIQEYERLTGLIQGGEIE